MERNCNFPRLVWMLVLIVRTGNINQFPTIVKHKAFYLSKPHWHYPLTKYFYCIIYAMSMVLRLILYKSTAISIELRKKPAFNRRFFLFHALLP